MTNAYGFYELESGLRNWHLADVDAASSARADTAARFDSVTAVGLAGVHLACLGKAGPLFASALPGFPVKTSP